MKLTSHDKKFYTKITIFTVFTVLLLSFTVFSYFQAHEHNGDVTRDCEDWLSIFEKELAYGSVEYSGESIYEHKNRVLNKHNYAEKYGLECQYTLSFTTGWEVIRVLSTIASVLFLFITSVMIDDVRSHPNCGCILCDRDRKQFKNKIQKNKEKSKMKLPYSFFPWVITLASVMLTYTNALGFTDVKWQYIVLPPLIVFSGIVILGITAAITGIQVFRWLFGKLINAAEYLKNNSKEE